MSKLTNDKPAFLQATKNKKDLGAWRQTEGSRKDMKGVKSYAVRRTSSGVVVFSPGSLKHDHAMNKESHKRVEAIQPSGAIC